MNYPLNPQTALSTNSLPAATYRAVAFHPDSTQPLQSPYYANGRDALLFLEETLGHQPSELRVELWRRMDSTEERVLDVPARVHLTLLPGNPLEAGLVDAFIKGEAFENAEAPGYAACTCGECNPEPEEEPAAASATIPFDPLDGAPQDVRDLFTMVSESLGLDPRQIMILKAQ